MSPSCSKALINRGRPNQPVLGHVTSRHTPVNLGTAHPHEAPTRTKAPTPTPRGKPHPPGGLGGPLKA
jgi:hypothetical protein